MFDRHDPERVPGFHDPLNKRHLRRLRIEWAAHYNRDRPHSSLGPRIPDRGAALLLATPSRHQIPRDRCVVANPVLGGLHH